MSKETITNNSDIQIIGLDIGRGYVKGYTEYNETPRECLFKSTVALGRDMNFENFDDPIYIEVNDEEYFAGILAEVEGDTAVSNLKDDKTTSVCQKLMFAALNKLAVVEDIKIMLGVPNKMFKKSVLNDIVNTYKGLSLKIKDKINGSYKNINIKDISIFREGDAALLKYVDGKDNFENTLCMVTVGFRTTEFSCYSNDLKFNDKLSDTKEIGNKTALEFVQRKLKAKGTIKTLQEIDTSSRYDVLKEIAYKNLSEYIEQEIESVYTNMNEVDVFIAGGTALNLNFKDYTVVNDAQMLTAKGLYLVGTNKFK